MFEIRRAAERGRTVLDWLDSRHTFSFGQYHDPAHMGFGVLRVINDDWVAPGGGFEPHAHRDMEIISYVLEGALAHEDSLGHGAVIRCGDVQRMSAGNGIRHSEFNASKEAPVHFLQIWILPEAKSIAPGYEQRRFPQEHRRGSFHLLVAPDGADGALTIHQDVKLYGALLNGPEQLCCELAAGRSAWVQLASGTVELNGEFFAAGDGAALRDIEALCFKRGVEAEILLFDLPGDVSAIA